MAECYFTGQMPIQQCQNTEDTHAQKRVVSVTK